MKKIPSPSSEIVIPDQRSRKSRFRSGPIRLIRENPPGRSSPSWLCCMSADRDRIIGVDQVLGQCLVGHGSCEQEPLTELAPELAQRDDLLGELDPFRDDVEVQAPPEP